MKNLSGFLVTMLLITTVACSGGGGGGVPATPAPTGGGSDTSSGGASNTGISGEGTSGSGTSGTSGSDSTITNATTPTAVPANPVDNSTPPIPVVTPAPEVPPVPAVPPVPDVPPVPAVIYEATIATPVNDASVEFNTATAAEVTLKGSVGPEGITPQWTASFEDGTPASVASPNLDETHVTLTQVGKYTITLQAKKGDAVVAESKVGVTLLAPTAPAAILCGMTDDGSYPLGEYGISLNCYNKDVKAYQYQVDWQLITPPKSQAILTGYQTGAKFIPDIVGDYTIVVTVANATGASASKSMTVHILAKRQVYLWGYLEKPFYVGGASATDWYVGSDHSVLHYNGKQWVALYATSNYAPTYSVLQLGPTEIYAGGISEVRQYVGNLVWKTYPLPKQPHVDVLVGTSFDIWGASSTGSGTGAFHLKDGVVTEVLDGEGITQVVQPDAGTVLLFGSPKNEVFVYKDGAYTKIQPEDNGTSHMKKCAIDKIENTIFCYDDAGYLYAIQYSGGKYGPLKLANSMPISNPVAIKVVDGIVYVMDADGTVKVPASDTEWATDNATPTPLPLSDAVGSILSATTRMIGGSQPDGKPVMYAWDPAAKAWAKTAIPDTSFNLNRIVKTDNGILLAGALKDGALLSFDPANKSLTPIALPKVKAVTDVLRPSPNNVWIKTDDPAIWHFDGQQWSSVTIPTGYTLSGDRIGINNTGDVVYGQVTDSEFHISLLKISGGQVTVLTMDKIVKNDMQFATLPDRVLGITVTTGVADEGVLRRITITPAGVKSEDYPDVIFGFKYIQASIAFAANDIYVAFGSPSTASTIMHYDGTQWTAQAIDPLGSDNYYINNYYITTFNRDATGVLRAMTNGGRLLTQDAAGKWTVEMQLPIAQASGLRDFLMMDNGEILYGGDFVYFIGAIQ